MNPNWDFSGRTAVVTGANRGIGAAIARALAEAGAAVHALDVTPPPDDPGYAAEFHAVDIGDSDSVAAVAAELPDDALLLVNNAGITRDRSLLKMSDDEWQAVINVNLSGAFRMIRALAPRMRTAGYGRIVNISSINGLRGKFGQANYSAAKGGLITLTKTAAREFGAKGVTVNAIAPGMVLTDMALALPKEYLQQAVDDSVTKELATPRDIANGVLFLLSDGARMITGEVIRVDAGQYI